MSNEQILPLVSCLCVTRNRPTKLRRAIDCFVAQGYPNKELVILVEEDDPETLSFLESYENESHRDICVHTVGVSPKLALGQLRNAAIHVCQGELFCQWDDDDWYHVDRLSAQVAALTRSHQSAAFLTHWFIFDASTKKAYFSPRRLWEGSILCKKSVTGGKLLYPALPRMEDTVFVSALVAKAGVYPQAAPTLYIYEFHSNNTWNQEHFELLLSMSQPLSEETSRLVAGIMAGSLSVEEGSRRLDSREVLEQVRFERHDAKESESLRRYREYMAQAELDRGA